MTVEILLSTYNGKAWIDEQIASIFSQGWPLWTLLIRDDGSKDDTVEKIERWQKLHPDKIRLIKGENVGVVKSFSLLLNEATENYIAFCDQDDIWKTDKLSHLMMQMRYLEHLYPGKPHLIHHDLIVVDEKLSKISPSFWKYTHLNGLVKNPPLRRLLTQNCVTGCACLINKSLKDLACPIPQEAIMHDWWLALVASAFGKITSYPEKLSLYRQHGNNALGAKPFLSKKLKFSSYRLQKEKTSLQAALFRTHFSKQLENQQAKLIEKFAKLEKRPYIVRMVSLLKHRFFKAGLIRNLIYLFTK